MTCSASYLFSNKAETRNYWILCKYSVFMKAVLRGRLAWPLKLSTVMRFSQDGDTLSGYFTMCWCAWCGNCCTQAETDANPVMSLNLSRWKWRTPPRPSPTHPPAHSLAPGPACGRQLLPTPHPTRELTHVFSHLLYADEEQNIGWK